MANITVKTNLTREDNVVRIIKEADSVKINV